MSPSAAHTYVSTAGSTLEYVPTAPESFPTAMLVPRPSQTLAVAPDLERPQRQLGAERRRLGMDAVGAPDHRRVAELVGARGDDGVERVERAARSRSHAFVSWLHSAVSMTSIDVRP